MSDTDSTADEVPSEELLEALVSVDTTIHRLEDAVNIFESITNEKESIEAELATLRGLSNRLEARWYATEEAATQDGEAESVASKYLDLEQSDLTDGDADAPDPEQYDPVDEDALQAAVDAREDAAVSAEVALKVARAQLKQVIEELEAGAE
jgi:hypothetical protein